MTETRRRVDNDEQVAVIGSERDPLTFWLGVIAAVLVVGLLAGVIFALLTGLAAQQAPRTAVEARLVILEQAVQQYPTSGDAWGDYIKALIAVGRINEAEEALGLALERVGGYETGPVAVAELSLLWQKGHYDEIVERADTLFDEQMEVRQAEVEELGGEDIRVEPDEIEPEPLIDILLYGARASGALEDWDGAIDWLTQGLEINPQAADLLTLRGEAYTRLGMIDEARADFETALTFIPDYEPALSGLALLDSGK